MGLIGDQHQALTWGAAFLLGVSLGRFIGQLRERRRDPKLHGAVANASKIIAAWRAVESLEIEGKLFSDELSVLMAGQKTFSEALSAAKPYQHNQGVLPAGPHPGRRLYKISPIAARTWWMDRSILTALTTPAIPGTKGWLSARLSASARGPSAPPRQLVIVGAGMDTRAWRLPLPPGLAVFEIDRSDVLNAKKWSLYKSGAEQQQNGASAARFPLRCGSWTPVPINLAKAAAAFSSQQLALTTTMSSLVSYTPNGENDRDPPSSARSTATLTSPRHAEQHDILTALQNAGFDPSAPCVWVLEGVLMYFEMDQVENLIAALAEASAPGSTLIGHALTEEYFENIVGSYSITSSSFSSPLPSARAGVALGTPNSASAAAGVGVAAVATPRTPRTPRSRGTNANTTTAATTVGTDAVFPVSVVKHWKSGLPLDPAPILEKAGGWIQQIVNTRAEVAHQICGNEPRGKCDFNIELKAGGVEQGEIFFTAKKPNA
jgi:O-methyltransferase involved in polyketide biosynthesis